jgi:hypothetical protein
MKRQLFNYQKIVIIFLLFLGFLTASGQGAAQTKKIIPDPRLYDCFGKPAVEAMMNNPRQLLYYNFFLDHAFFVTDGKDKKPSEGINIFTVQCKDPGPNGEVKYFNEDVNKFDPKTFNVLKYQFKPEQDNYAHYLLGTTGRLIIFYPQKDFAKMYREYLKSFNIE